MFFVFVCFIFISCIYLWRRNVRFRRRLLNLPPIYPGVWPIVGHSLMFVSNGDESYLSDLIKRASNIVMKNGGIMTAFIGDSPYFFVTDPTYCTTIANECPDKDTIVYGFAKSWLGDGLATGNGDVWKRHRKLLNPAFSQQLLNSFIEVFNVQSKQLTNNLEVKVGKAPFEHSAYLEYMSLETVYQTVIGINSEKYHMRNKNAYINNVKEMLSIFITRIQNFWLHNEFIYKLSTLKKKQDTSVKIMKEIFIEILNAKKAANASEPKTEAIAFLDLLLDYATDGSLSNEEVWDEVNTLVMAAYDTSATCLVYTLMLLGSHPDVQDKVYKELSEVFGSSFRDVDKIDLTKLVYLEAVIKESLRIYPLAPVIIRRIIQDLKLDGYILPAGSSCVLLIEGLHRHQVWGSDADQFRPERWLESPAPPRNAFGAFGLGKRNCIGKTYAMMFMKTALTHVVRRYRVTADVSKLKFKLHAVLKPHYGCLISIENRTP